MTAMPSTITATTMPGQHEIASTMNVVSDIKGFSDVPTINCSSVDPLAEFLLNTAAPEIVVPILKKLPPKTLHNLITSARSRHLYLHALPILWRVRDLYKWKDIMEFIETINSPLRTCDFGTFVDALYIRPRNLARTHKDKIANDIWKKIFGPCPNLKRVILFEPIYPDLTLKILAHYCPGMQTLYCHCDQVSDQGIKVLSQGCPRLERFSSSSLNMSDTGILSLIEGCPRLTFISCPRVDVSDVIMLAMSKRCPLLDEIEIGATAVTHRGLLSIADGCPLLRKINLHGMDISFSAVEIVLARLSSAELHIHRLKLTEIERERSIIWRDRLFPTVLEIVES